MNMDERFPARSCSAPSIPTRARRRSARSAINQFAPYLMNRIMERWNGNLAEALKAPNMSTT